jgi:hypothetical protein
LLKFEISRNLPVQYDRTLRDSLLFLHPLKTCSKVTVIFQGCHIFLPLLQVAYRLNSSEVDMLTYIFAQVAWEIFTPLLHRIDAGKLPLIPYKQGSRGPTEADDLNTRLGYVRTDGYCWIPPTLKVGNAA